MAHNALAMQGARASAGMALTSDLVHTNYSAVCMGRVEKRQIDDLLQDWSDSTANALTMGLLQSFALSHQNVNGN